MKNKGFTLVEMLGVVIIIGIIAIIAFNTFTGNLKELRDDYYNNTERTLIESGKEFFNDNRKFRPDSILSAQKVTIGTLTHNDYVNAVEDYNGNNCKDDSYVIIIKESKDDYLYHTCLVCPEDNYDNTDDPLCDSSWLDPSTISYGLGQLPTVYIYKGTPRSELRKLLEVPISIVKKDGEGNVLKEISGVGVDDVPTVLPKDMDVVNPDVPGTYEVHYEYFSEEQDTEEKKEGKTKVVVYENSIPTVKIDYKNIVANNLDGETSIDRGTYTSGKWVQEITINLSAPKDAHGNVIGIPEPGVKIAKYQWNKNGKWHDLCPGDSGSMDSNGTCVITEQGEMNQDGIKFRMIDTNGKISVETYPITIRIDNTKPTCTLKRDKENPDGTNGWYKTPVTVSFNKNEDLPSANTIPGAGDAISRIRTSNITNMSLPEGSRVLNRISSNNNILHSVDTAGVEYRGYVEDQAGNFYICKTDFKKDGTKPACSIAFSGTMGENGWYRSNVGVSFGSNTDNLSRVAKYGIGSYDGSRSITHTEETSSKTYTGYIMDNAGNVATCANTLKKDTTVPTCSLNLSGTIGNNDWYKSNVVVGFATANDERSGVAKYGIGSYDGSRSLTHTADTSSKTYTGYIKDNAGNTANCSVSFKKDSTNPTVSWSTNVSLDGDGSYHSNSGITVTGACSDATSGTTSSTSQNISSPTPSSGKSVSLTCVDNAGNTVTYSSSYNVKTHGQSSACGWNSCLTGENTCSYGCSRCSYDCSTNLGRKSTRLCRNLGGDTGANGDCIVYKTCTRNCNCSSCYHGHNTCSGGYNTCWHN